MSAQAGPARPSDRGGGAPADDRPTERDGGPHDPAAAEAWNHVRGIVRASGSSFIAGMRVLPKARREAMFAIYAFCREVDDVADGDERDDRKLAHLARWRDEVARIYDGMPQTPTGRALVWVVRQFDPPRAEFLTVVDGMETDARPSVRMADSKALDNYCRQVAGAVGVLSIHAFGVTAPPAQEFAIALGNALQKTNILRDVAEDAARDRVYLPADLLRRHGIEQSQVEEILGHPQLPRACRELAGEARRHFADADRLLGRIDRRPMRPAILMMEVYRRLLDRLESRGWRRLQPAVRLSRIEKLWIVLRYGLV